MDCKTFEEEMEKQIEFMKKIMNENEMLKQQNKTLEEIHNGDMKIVLMLKDKLNGEREKNKKQKEEIKELKEEIDKYEEQSHIDDLKTETMLDELQQILTGQEEEIKQLEEENEKLKDEQ